MNIREAAAELDTTPKALRKLLRSMNGGQVVGLGGTYNLTRADVNRLRSKVKKVKPVADNSLPHLDQTPGFDPDVLPAMRTNPYLRKQVMKQREERRQRLLARLHEPEIKSFCDEVRRRELEIRDNEIMSSRVV